jgi:hypothetical protein
VESEEVSVLLITGRDDGGRRGLGGQLANAR